MDCWQWRSALILLSTRGLVQQFEHDPEPKEIVYYNRQVERLHSFCCANLSRTILKNRTHHIWWCPLIYIYYTNSTHRVPVPDEIYEPPFELPQFTTFP